MKSSSKLGREEGDVTRFKLNWASATPWSPNLLRSRHKHRGRGSIVGCLGAREPTFLSLSPRGNSRMSMSLAPTYPPTIGLPLDRTIQTGIEFLFHELALASVPSTSKSHTMCWQDRGEFTHTRIANEFRDCRPRMGLLCWVPRLPIFKGMYEEACAKTFYPHWHKH